MIFGGYANELKYTYKLNYLVPLFNPIRLCNNIPVTTY